MPKASAKRGKKNKRVAEETTQDEMVTGEAPEDTPMPDSYMRQRTVLSLIQVGNGLSPVWHQTIIWTNIESLLIEDLRTNFNEIWNQIQPFWKLKSIKNFRLQNGGHFVRSVKF